ncbi:hypothetical protein J6590_071774 [Homalodisca vitripennis]|nr:hypothetical protein J6590_071774 [Homalodisca vitripennis]
MGALISGSRPIRAHLPDPRKLHLFLLFGRPVTKAVTDGYIASSKRKLSRTRVGGHRLELKSNQPVWFRLQKSSIYAGGDIVQRIILLIDLPKDETYKTWLLARFAHWWVLGVMREVGCSTTVEWDGEDYGISSDS